MRKSYDNYNNRGGDYQKHHDGGNKIEQRLQSLRLDNGTKNESAKESAGPKKMTWASIASQPAKPTVTSTTSTTKRKGLGPPPPIIPGKHDLELNDGWDAPKNVVPPSPPVIPQPQPEINDKKSSLDGSPAWPTLDKAQSQLQNPNPTERNLSTSNNTTGTTSQQQQQQQHQNHHSQYNPNHSRGGGYNSHNSVNNHHQNYNNNSYSHHGNSNGNNYNGNSNYSQGRQYTPRGDNNSSYKDSGDHYYNRNNNNHHSHQNSYNDFPKPYHQHPHQMPTAPSQSYNRSDNGAISRSNFSRDNNNSSAHQNSHHEPPASKTQQPPSASAAAGKVAVVEEKKLSKLQDADQYNPGELDLSKVDKARFFVIKSYSEDDIHRSIKYEIWCSTEHGNKRLDQAFHEREKENGVIYLFFSVNSSGHFCGVAQMITPVDYDSHSSVWSQDKWKGSFRVKWIYVKDVPNPQLRHIRLENNENKPVTNSRDTQEVPNHHGIQMMKIIHSFKHTTSIFDDFTHYEKRQEEEDNRKHEPADDFAPPRPTVGSMHSSNNRQFENGRSFNNDRDYNGSSNNDGFERGGSFNGRNGGGFNKFGNNSGLLRTF